MEATRNLDENRSTVFSNAVSALQEISVNPFFIMLQKYVGRRFDC